MPTTLHTLLACKVMALEPALSAAAKQVGAAIIEHYNRQDGRCDPGVERLSSLLDLDRSTILRSVAALHKADLIIKTRHGGRSQTNSYEPNWERLMALHQIWRDRLHKGGRHTMVAK